MMRDIILSKRGFYYHVIITEFFWKLVEVCLRYCGGLDWGSHKDEWFYLSDMSCVGWWLIDCDDWCIKFDLVGSVCVGYSYSRKKFVSLFKIINVFCIKITAIGKAYCRYLVLYKYISIELGVCLLVFVTLVISI